MGPQNTAPGKRAPPFPKGVSGNPGGRPKGFAKLIRQSTKQGQELVDLALQVMRGEIIEMRMSAKGEPVEVGPSCRDRMDAVKWLADRGWGKVPDVDVEEDAEGPSAESIGDDDLAAALDAPAVN